MTPRILFLVLLAAAFTESLSLEADRGPLSNITVIGFVFCDACSNNAFSKHSYFLKGAQVQVTCKFRVSSSSTEEISIDAERITDRLGSYKVDIPPVDGFECKQGHEIRSFCRANLIKSSSSLCDVPGLRSSSAHIAVKSKEANICFFDLNALNYRPAKIDAAHCGTKRHVLEPGASLNSSLFFWPPFLPFGLPWPHLPPLPFPFPPSFPFPLPFWFPFPSPPFLPFPFSPSPNTPAFPFPFPPFPSLPPISSFFPPYSAPPSPGQPSPPSNVSPGAWFPFFPPSPPSQLQSQHP